MMPGVKPASAAPSSSRMMYSCVGVCTRPMPAATRPQLTMIRAIHRLAPTRASIRLLGTSSRTYVT